MSTKANPEMKPAASISASPFTPARKPLLQRKCACGGSTNAKGDCENCNDHKLPLQRRATDSVQIGNVPSSVHNVLNSPGSPLDATTRSFMEPRFGHDFGGVRIHTDSQAAESARAVNAHAYTVGQDIVFGAEKYQPDSSSGRELIAHELAHTIQQGNLQRSSSDLTLSPGEDSRLESEADSAARTIASGGDSPHISQKHQRPILSRAADDSSPVTSDQKDKLKDAGFEEMDPPPAGVTRIRRFLVLEDFPLPVKKGPGAKKVWDDRAKGGGLESIIDVTGKPMSVLKQERPGPETLREYWLSKVGWTENDAGNNWKIAGGDSASFSPPKAGKETCEMDHIIELQAGGTNIKENIQVLDPSENASSGATIRGYLSQKGRALRDAVPELKLKEIILHWDKVTQEPASKPGPCYKVEESAVATFKVDKKKSSEGADLAKRYPIHAGGSKTEILITEEYSAKKKAVPIKDSELAENRSAATLIPGLTLIDLHRKTTPDTIDAEIDTSEKTRLPGMTLKKEGRGATVGLKVDKTGKLSRTKGAVNIDFTYQYLSSGKITKLDIDESGATSWSGRITPRIQFLGPLDIEYKKGALQITKGLEEETLKKRSVLGMRLTKADIKLQLAPAFKPEGILEMQLGSGEKPVVKASLNVTADSAGLVAAGKLNLNIPKMQTSEVDVSYKGGEGRNEWKAEIHIKSEDIKLGPSISVTGQFDGMIEKGDIKFTGKINATFPNENSAELKLRKESDHWILFGEGIFKFPRLQPTTVKVRYNLTRDILIASGKTGFKIPAIGLGGDLDEVTFTISKDQPLKVHGKGELIIKKGKAEGKANVELHPDKKFTGKGTIKYKLKENVIVTGTVELDKHEKLHILGELEVTRYEIFKKYGDKKDIFTVDIPVPVPGFSIAKTGLVFHLRGGISAAYSFGPGTLEPIKFSAGFDPLEEDPDLKLTVTGTVKVPASATLSAWITGSLAIEIDVLIGGAGVEGGLKLQGDLILNAGAFANFNAEYKQKKLSAKLVAGIDTKLLLGITLTAFVRAWAGAFGFSGEVRKDWTLGRKTIDTHLGFFISAPFEYADDTGVKLPDYKDITLKKPEITTENLKRILGELFGSATPKEVRS